MYLLRLALILSSTQAFAFHTSTKKQSFSLRSIYYHKLSSSISHLIPLFGHHDSTKNEHQVEIRNWKKGDGDKIVSLLTSAQEDEDFDPEGPIYMDCINEDLIQESYSEDGACLLVAASISTSSHPSQGVSLSEDHEDTNNHNTSTIIGTAALTIGTSVKYLKSGASISSSDKVTGAIRRVCAIEPFIIQRLLRNIEDRAKEVGVNELIVLAYNANTTTSKNYRPNSTLLEIMGYNALSSSSNFGSSVVQYTKLLESNKGQARAAKVDATDLGETALSLEKIDSSRDLILFGAVSVSLLALLLAFIGVTSFMGLELIPSSNDNRGVGSPLSIQELQILRQDEKLQRTDLDGSNNNGDGTGGGVIRQWSDLSVEERQEEIAMMKIIQGKNSRIK